MTRKIHFDQPSNYPFDLGKVLYAAQDFRWCKWDDEWHSGVLAGNLIHIRQVDSVLEYKSHSGADLDNMLRSYFRLDDPIDMIYDELSSIDGKLCELVNDYPWMRVLRQPDPWECLVAYICAGHSRIDNTIERVERIAELGCRIHLNDDVRTTFPSSQQVLTAGEEELRARNLRFPNKHPKAIVQVARLICDDKLELDYLAQPEVTYQEARSRLMDLYCVGPKTADCVCLFGLDKTDSFPVDVWVERAVKNCAIPPTGSSYRKIVEWAMNRFGEYAGYANQFLFYEEREKSHRNGGEFRRCRPFPSS